jgi:hypothetical protein
MGGDLLTVGVGGVVGRCGIGRKGIFYRKGAKDAKERKGYEDVWAEPHPKSLSIFKLFVMARESADGEGLHARVERRC